MLALPQIEEIPLGASGSHEPVLLRETLELLAPRSDEAEDRPRLAREPQPEQPGLRSPRPEWMGPGEDPEGLVTPEVLAGGHGFHVDAPVALAVQAVRESDADHRLTGLDGQGRGPDADLVPS